MRFIHLAVLAIFFFSGCRSKEAYEYNEKILAIEKSLGPSIQKTEEDVDKFIQLQQYDSASFYSEKMETIVADKINEIQNIPAPNVKEGENLKKAVIRYFNYIKSMYTAYKVFGQQDTEEGRDRERQRIMKVASEKNSALEDIKQVQKTYAEANGFKVQ